MRHYLTRFRHYATLFDIMKLKYNIRHVPLGTCCVSRSVESSIHSLSSTSFQVELGAPGGGGSSSPFLWSFLRGGTRDYSPTPASVPPPSRPPKIQLFRSAAASCALVRQPWRQDVQTSPEIAKKTPSWSQSLPTYLPKPSQGSLQDSGGGLNPQYSNQSGVVLLIFTLRPFFPRSQKK